MIELRRRSTIARIGRSLTILAVITVLGLAAGVLASCGNSSQKAPIAPNTATSPAAQVAAPETQPSTPVPAPTPPAPKSVAPSPKATAPAPQSQPDAKALEAAKAAAEKAAADKAAADKAAAEKLAADKAAADKAIADKAAADKAIADKAAADKAIADKAAADKAIADKAAADKAIADKAAADKAAADKAAAAKTLAAKAAADKALADKAAADKAAAAKIAADKAAADKAKTEAAKAEQARLASLVVPEPGFKSPAGVYAEATSVAIEVALKEAQIVYTLDGTEPNPARSARYSGPVTVGQSSLLRARAFVPGGKESAVVNAEYAIGEVFAAPGGKGLGTRTSPFATVSEAVKKAQSLNINSVKVAAGVFDDLVEITSPLFLSGGWKADFSGPSTDRSVIRGKAAGSTTKKAPSFALKISGKAATSQLRVARFELRGGEASYSSGILVSDGASPVIDDCVAYGGSASYGYGAVVLSGAAPAFGSSRLDGGEGATSYGLSADSARATVSSCLLLAGNGSVGGYGLSATGSTIVVKDSVLAAKAANINNGAAFYDSKDSSLANCTIVGGSGKEANGVFISASNPSIENCIVSAAGQSKSFGVVANYGESSPARLVGTLFLGCAGGFYFEAATKTAYVGFDAAGRPATKEGTPLAARVNATGDGLGAFTLGPAPLYAAPSSAPAGKGSSLR
jgi:hypothetical protein